MFNAYLGFEGLVFGIQVCDLGRKDFIILLPLQAETLGALTILQLPLMVLVDGIGALGFALMRAIVVA